MEAISPEGPAPTTMMSDDVFIAARRLITRCVEPLIFSLAKAQRGKERKEMTHPPNQQDMSFFRISLY
jgi:hypothetical protein